MFLKTALKRKLKHIQIIKVVYLRRIHALSFLVINSLPSLWKEGKRNL